MSQDTTTETSAEPITAATEPSTTTDTTQGGGATGPAAAPAKRVRRPRARKSTTPPDQDPLPEPVAPAADADSLSAAPSSTSEQARAGSPAKRRRAPAKRTAKKVAEPPASDAAATGTGPATAEQPSPDPAVPAAVAPGASTDEEQAPLAPRRRRPTKAVKAFEASTAAPSPEPDAVEPSSVPVADGTESDSPASAPRTDSPTSAPATTSAEPIRMRTLTPEALLAAVERGRRRNADSESRRNADSESGQPADGQASGSKVPTVPVAVFVTAEHHPSVADTAHGTDDATDAQPVSAPDTDTIETTDTTGITDPSEAESAETDTAETPSDHSDEGEEESGTRRRRRRRGGRGRRRTGEAADSDDDTDSSDTGGSGAGADGTAPSGQQRATPGSDSDSDRAEATDQAKDADGAAAPQQTPSRQSTRSDDSDEPDGETSTRRRRRRRRRGSSGSGESGESGESDSEDSSTTEVREREPRRRRPRAGREEEVTSSRGSTRLEAKRVRRKEGRDANRGRPPILTEAEFLARRESVTRTMLVRETYGRTQIGVLEDDILVEHYIAENASNSDRSMIGDVYLGRVQNVLPAMEAAFVDIGRGRNGVLYAGEVSWDAAGLEGRPKRIENVLKSGQPVLVQVTKDPIGHKGARLTAQISLAGRYVVYVPNGSMSGISRKLPDTERARLKKILKELIPADAGVIVRTAAEGATDAELTADVDRLKGQWSAIEKKAKGSAPNLLQGEPDLALKVVRDVFNSDFDSLIVAGDAVRAELVSYVESVAPNLADRVQPWTGTEDLFTAHRVDEQLVKALDRKVWLPSGGSLVIDRTEAMTVVDVNTGRFTGSGGNLEETVTENNLEAAEELVRQLRLRDIGGIIVVDFIDMIFESNRDLVVRRLVECLGRDRTKHQVAEVTSLGLVQMTRKRIGRGLLEVFGHVCETCKGRGVVVELEQGHEHQENGSGPAGPPNPGNTGRRHRQGTPTAEGAPADGAAADSPPADSIPADVGESGNGALGSADAADAELAVAGHPS